MLLKKLLFLIVATVSLAAAAPSAMADELEDIIQAGVIKIAVPADFPPFGSVGKAGEVEGYDVEVARLVARDLGVKLQLVPLTSPNRVPYLLTGKVDLVVSYKYRQLTLAIVVVFVGAQIGIVVLVAGLAIAFALPAAAFFRLSAASG